MIPLRDLNPTTIRPDVTIALVAINVVVFLLTWGDLESAVRTFGAIPFHFTGMEPERLRGFRVPPPVEPEWWYPARALTSAFLHGGFLHIAMNMWFLWVFGDNIEQRFGRVRYLVFYLVCALGAVAAQVASSPASAIPMVGASGAVSGVLGAYMRLYPTARVIGLVPIGFLFINVVWSAFAFIGLWFVMQALSALLTPSDIGGTAWWAHIGGFVIGWLWAPVLARPVRKRIEWTVP